MEFCQKLQELRKGKGLTQDELAKRLFVSRTAISKWESGRGYPNIQSLKEIANFFSVTVDELLSGEEVIKIAEEDNARKQKHARDWVFGVLDIGALLLFFLPFFADRSGNSVQTGAFLMLTGMQPYLKILYAIALGGMALLGFLRLALQKCSFSFWEKTKNIFSFSVNALVLLLFIVSLQPYPSILVFVPLIIKLSTFIKG